MFFPYRLCNGTWVALYGSELGRFPDFEVRRQVGLARFEASGDGGGFEGEWTRLSALNPLDDSFRPAAPGIENPVVTRTMDGRFFIAVYHIYTGATIGVSYSEDGIHWVRQAGDLQLGSGHCG